MMVPHPDYNLQIYFPATTSWEGEYDYYYLWQLTMIGLLLLRYEEGEELYHPQSSNQSPILILLIAL